jgi:hypothetical protein
MRKKLTMAEDQILNGLKKLEGVDRELIAVLKKIKTLDETRQLLLEKNLM